MKIKRIFIWLLITVASLALLLGILLAFLPTIVSSNWGKSKIEEFTNRSIAGRVSFKNIEMSFFGPQRFETIVLKDPEDQFVLSIEELVLDVSLPNLVLKQFSQSSLQIQNLNLNLVEGEKGDSNVRQALQSPASSLLPFTSLGSPIYFHAENLDLKLLPESLLLKTNGTTYQNELQGAFNIDIAFVGFNETSLKQLAESPELFMRSNTRFHIDAVISNLPVALLDWALAMKDPNLRGLAQQALANTLNLTVHNADQIFAFEIEAASPNLNAHFTADFSEDRIAITKPGTIRLSIAPRLLQYFLDPSFDIQLGQPTNLLIAIERFILPIDVKNHAYKFESFTLKGRMDIREALLQSKSNFNDILLDQMSAVIETSEDSPQMALKISGQASQNGDPVQIGLETWLDKTKRINFRTPPPMKVNLKHIPIGLVDEILSLGNSLENYIGRYADLSLDTILQKDSLDIAIEFKSEKVRIPSMLLNISQDITLLEPIKLEYQLDVKNLEQLQLPQQLLKFQIMLDPVRNFQNIQDLSQLDLSGAIDLAELAIQAPKIKEIIHIQNLHFPWNVKAKENKANGEVHGTLYTRELASGNIDCTATLTNWLNLEKIDLSKAFLYSKFELKQLSNQLIGAFSENNELTKLIGPFLDVNVDANFSNEQFKGNGSISFAAEGLQGSGRMTFNPDVISITPFTIDLKITPERFTALRGIIRDEKTDHLTLAETAHVILTAKGQMIRSSSEIGFSIKADTDHLIVLDILSGHGLTFENIKAEAESSDLYKKLDFTLTAKQKSVGQTSDFLAKGIVEGAFPNGKFDPTQVSLLLDIKISELPLNLFCDTFCVDKSIDQKIEALFGSTLNVDIHTALKQANGPIQATLKGPNGQVDLNARLENGMLYLNQPFQAKFTATKDLGNSILQDIFPLLSGTVSADQPFTITIDHTGFAFPVRNFDPARIQIAKGTLSLGHVKFTKDGQLGEILSLLTPPDANLISVWFTPLYFSMHQGELNLSRIDMLISNHFPIAAWGTVNFPKDKIQMVIGLSGDAISYAFNVNVDSAYILQLPLKGKIASPSLDKSKATTKIGALVAHSQKSTKGTILGTVLDLASGGLTEEKPPKPTTQPFPWEKQMEIDRQKRVKEEPKSQAASPLLPEEAKPKKEKKSESKKLIEKAANSLLDNVFK